MSRSTLGRGLLCAGAAAVAVVLSLLVAPHLGASTKVFPLAVLGIAGVLVLIAAVVALEPAWLISIGLALSMYSGDWKYMHIPGPLDRMATFVGIAAVIVRPWFVKDAPRLEVRRIHWLLGLLAAYATVSAVLSGTIAQHAALFELLDRLGVEPFLLYLVAPAAFATAAQRRVLLVTLALIGAYLGLTAIFERVGPHALVIPSYIENPSIGIHFDRARGPFLEAGADGLAMFDSLVACAILLSQGVGRHARWALWTTIGLCLLGLVLTLTRQVWLGAGVGLLAAGLLSPYLRRLIPVAAIVLGVLVAGAIFTIPGLRASVVSRTNDQASLWDRYNSDSAALRMLEARPLTGFGWGEFPEKSPRYYHLARTYPLTSVPEVHNVVLSNAAELGLLGVVPWLVLIVIVMVHPLVRRGPPELDAWKLAAIAIAIAWFVQSNFAPVSYAFANYIPWVFAAIAYGRRSEDEAGEGHAALLQTPVVLQAPERVPA